jgi:hypothetical protein
VLEPRALAKHGQTNHAAHITRALDLDFEVAVPLTEPRYDTNDNTPRLNLRVSQSF